MKPMQILRRVLPFALAAVILALGLLLPQWAFQRLRQSYLTGESVISASAVHPYGEAYEEKKTALLAELRMVYEMDRSSTTAAIALNKATAQQRDDYAAALEQATAFLDILQDQLPGVDFTAFLDKLDGGEKALYYSQGGTDYFAYLEVYEEAQGATDLLGFPLDSGTPVVLSLTLPITQETDNDQVWNALLDAYQQFTGILFLTRDTQSETSDSYSVYDSTENKTSTMFYAYDRKEAVSADSVFALSADLHVNDTYLSLSVYLSENGVSN
jgi:hypothetical protein